MAGATRKTTPKTGEWPRGRSSRRPQTCQAVDQVPELLPGDRGDRESSQEGLNKPQPTGRPGVLDSSLSELGSSLVAQDPSMAPPQDEPKWTFASMDIREKAKVRGLATRRGGRTRRSPSKAVQPPPPRPASGVGSRGPRDPGIRRLSRASTLTQSRSMSSWLRGH